jgi:hypothetical protein
MSEAQIRIEFRHPILDKSLGMDVSRTIGKALSGLGRGVPPADVAARLYRLFPTLPVEVLDVLAGALSAVVLVDGREVPLGAVFVADMLDTAADNPKSFLPHVIGVYAGHALAGSAPLRWLLSFSLASLFMFLNLDPGFYRKCIDESLTASVRTRQERLYGCLNDLDFKER